MQDGGNYRFKDFSEHSMKFYYFERGMTSSNCKISFNIPVTPTGTVQVSKEVQATNDVIGDMEGQFRYKVQSRASDSDT